MIMFSKCEALLMISIRLVNLFLMMISFCTPLVDLVLSMNLLLLISPLDQILLPCLKFNVLFKLVNFDFRVTFHQVKFTSNQLLILLSPLLLFLSLILPLPMLLITTLVPFLNLECMGEAGFHVAVAVAVGSVFSEEIISLSVNYVLKLDMLHY